MENRTNRNRWLPPFTFLVKLTQSHMQHPKTSSWTRKLKYHPTQHRASPLNVIVKHFPSQMTCKNFNVRLWTGLISGADYIPVARAARKGFLSLLHLLSVSRCFCSLFRRVRSCDMDTYFLQICTICQPVIDNLKTITPWQGIKLNHAHLSRQNG